MECLNLPSVQIRKSTNIHLQFACFPVNVINTQTNLHENKWGKHKFVVRIDNKYYA